jgi:EAL and modified HD-GYP domain-containing signal transduction protein
MQKENKVFTAHQPILDSEINIYGYEFFSRSSMKDEKSNTVHTATTDTKTLFSLFSNFDLEHLLNSKKVFLNCILELSDTSDYFDLLSPKNVYLEVSLPSNPDDLSIIDSIAEKMVELKERGFHLACSEVVFESKYEKWFNLIDCIKFSNTDISKFSQEDLRALLTQVKKGKEKNKILIAEKVETRQQFDLLKKVKFDYFQGFFFSKPINMAVKITNPGMTTMLKLINLVIAEAEFKDIEDILKTDAAISFKLLRYLNSYGVGGGQKVETFNRALMILGYKKLLKWLTILFTSVEKKQGSDIISKTALMRAKFMENIALEIDKRDADSYFMVGMFSMLDALLDVRLDIALNSINISDEIKNSVLKQEGKYAELLHIAKMLEKNEWIEILASLFKLGIDTDMMNEKYMEAIKWVEELKI